MAARQSPVDAPIDIIPLFVRAGSILPLGEPVESTNENQKIASLRVYPGADADLTSTTTTARPTTTKKASPN